MFYNHQNHKREKQIRSHNRVLKNGRSEKLPENHILSTTDVNLIKSKRE